MKNFALFLIVLFVFIGCNSKHNIPKNSMISKKDIEHTTVDGNRSFKTNKDDGLFIFDDGRIYIKAKARSMTEIIDYLTIQSRMNYSIFTKLTNDIIQIANKEDLKANLPWNEVRGKTYKNFNEFKKELTLLMNSVTNNKYQIIQSSIGISIIGKKKLKKSYSKVFLHNISASEVKTSIDSFYSSGIKPKYSIVILPYQNSLVIQAKKKVIEEMINVIISIDSHYPQVLIEAQVFEYDDSINRLIGTSIEQVSQGSDYKRTIKTNFSEGVSNLLPTFFKELTNVGKKQSLLYSIAMQDREGNVKVVAEPRVVLKPGTVGELKMETKKYVVVSGVNSSQLETIDTGIILKITPTILSKNTILLDLELEQSDFIQTIEQDIIQSINKNTVKTSVVAFDGELISIGGIYVEKKSDFSSGIPYLKNIPVLGVLFGSENKSSSRIMIEFMIRPSIKDIEKKLTKIKKEAYLFQNSDKSLK